MGYEPSARADAANMQLGNSGLLSHCVGVVALALVGMLRSFNAPPTLVALDNRSLAPLFGALVIEPAGLLDGLGRLQAPPQLLPHAEWLDAVGLAKRAP